jgi:alpha-1,3-glucan synthase
MKQNLANFITTLLLPGIPMLEWGEEQAFYVLDNTANNYVFGRQSMSSATAWQDHGCYTVGNAKIAPVGHLFTFTSTLHASITNANFGAM